MGMTNSHIVCMSKLASELLKSTWHENSREHSGVWMDVMRVFAITKTQLVLLQAQAMYKLHWACH